MFECSLYSRIVVVLFLVVFNVFNVFNVSLSVFGHASSNHKDGMTHKIVALCCLTKFNGYQIFI